VSSYTSQAYIERIRAEQLERERQEQLRQLREAAAQYNLRINKLTAMRSNILTLMNTDIEQIKNTDELSYPCQIFNTSKETAIKDIDAQISRSLPSDPAGTRSLTSLLDGKIYEIEKNFNNAAAIFTNRVKQYTSGKARIKELERFTNNLAELITKNPDVTDVDFSKMLQRSEETRTSIHEAINVDAIIDELNGFINSYKLESRHIQSLVEIKNYLTGNADAKDKQIEAEKYLELKPSLLKALRQFDEFGKSYDNYLALHAQAMTFRENKVPPVNPRSKSTFASLSNLNEEVKRLELDNRRTEQEKYKRESIAKVFEQFNIKLSRPLEMEKQSGFTNYLFKDSSGMPVYVGISADTLIVDPAVIDPSDNDKVRILTDVSNDEKNYISDHKSEFCKKIKQVYKVLSDEYGITFKHISEDGERVKKLYVKGEYSTMQTWREQSRREEGTSTGLAEAME